VDVVVGTAIESAEAMRKTMRVCDKVGGDGDEISGLDVCVGFLGFV
jgi:hypothetical protein